MLFDLFGCPGGYGRRCLLGFMHWVEMLAVLHTDILQPLDDFGNLPISSILMDLWQVFCAFLTYLGVQEAMVEDACWLLCTG